MSRQRKDARSAIRELFRPLSFRPVSGGVNQPENDDALASVRQWLKRISDDVGKADDRLFVATRHAAATACRHSAEPASCRFDTVKDFACRIRTVGRDVGDD